MHRSGDIPGMSGADAPVHTPDVEPDGGHPLFVRGFTLSSPLPGDNTGYCDDQVNKGYTMNKH